MSDSVLPCGYRFERLGLDDAEDVMRLQKEVTDSLFDADSYVPITDEEGVAVLSDQGMAVGVRDGADLVGFYSVRIPTPYPWMMTKVGLQPKDQEKSAYILAIFVHPRCRGQRLQNMMGNFLRAEMAKTWQGRYLSVVVHPDNIASVREQFAQRMIAVSLQDMFGGKPRLLFFRDLLNQASTPAVARTIPLACRRELSEALDEGWRGTNLSRSDDGWAMDLFKL